MKKILLVIAPLALAAKPAFAHVGVGASASFAAGVAHPLAGIDHMAVMLAVGVWAALQGGRALWAWPATFVAVMLIGGALGIARVPLLNVEPTILASVVALGIVVALTIRLPVWAGALVIGAFAVFHGHTHGSEFSEPANSAEYMAGLAMATWLLHAFGIGFALLMDRVHARALIRVAGLACVLAGGGMAAGVL